MNNMYFNYIFYIKLSFNIKLLTKIKIKLFDIYIYI